MWTRIALELTSSPAAEVAVRIIVNSGLICSALLTLSLILLPRSLADWCSAALLILSSGLIFALLINGDLGKKVLEAAPLFGSLESKGLALIIGGLFPESNTKHQTLGFIAGACLQLAGSILLIRNYGPVYVKDIGTLGDEVDATGAWPGENLARAAGPQSVGVDGVYNSFGGNAP